MSKKIIGLGLAALLSFSSFAAVQIVNEPTSVECGGEDGKKKKSDKKKKSCCKKGTKECAKSKGTEGAMKEETK